jgi:hypothetical protein
MQQLKNKFNDFDLKSKLASLLGQVENNSSKIILERAYKNLNQEDMIIENMKVISESQENDILVNRLQVLESLTKELKIYDWHKDILAFINEATKFLADNSILIILESMVYDLKNEKNSNYYTGTIKKIQECSEAEKPVEMILETLKTEKWIPLVKRLYEYAETLKGSYNGKNPNFEVSKVYSPVEIVNESSYLFHSNGLNLTLTEGKIEVYKEAASNSFASLCQIAENAKFDKDVMRVYPNNQHVLDIEFLAEGAKVMLDNKEIAAKDLDTYLVTKGIVSFNESAKLGSLQRAINEGNKIKEIDFAYNVKSKIYEGVSATVFNVEDKLFLQLTNHGMKENRIVECESANDAIATVKEFMNFDISESVKYLIDEEHKIEVEKEKAISAIQEKIDFLRENLTKIDEFEKTNGLTESIKEARQILVDELAVQEELKKNTLIEKINDEDYVNGELNKGVKLAGLGGTNVVKVHALQYAKAGNLDKIDIITSTGKKFQIEKSLISVKL